MDNAFSRVFYKSEINFPASEDQRKETADGFWDCWQFLDTLGAIDGSHIPNQATSEHPEVYHNYKDWHLLIFLAVCDHVYMDYQHVYIMVKGSKLLSVLISGSAMATFTILVGSMMPEFLDRQP